MVCTKSGWITPQHAHPLEKESKITPAMLHENPFVECPPCEAHQQTMGILAGAGMKLNISCRAEHKGFDGHGIKPLPILPFELNYDNLQFSS